ncbi:hypothetical protein MWU75_18795, partial [Ornithinimicrobium sp. F0845]|nr:hypothetical protein [Ornithinimicrobium sp. F0845]
MARHTEVFEASGGGVSVLEARLAAVLADPPVREVELEEIAPVPDCSVVVEFVSLAEDAVIVALAGLGVAPAECAVLTDLAQACASVTRRGAAAPGQEFFTRIATTGSSAAEAPDSFGPGAADDGPHHPTGPSGPGRSDASGSDPADPPDSVPADAAPVSGEEAAVVKGRASSLVGAVSTLSRAAGRLERVLICGARELTAAQGKLLLADKGVVSMDELTPAQTDAWRADAKKRARTDLEFE